MSLVTHGAEKNEREQLQLYVVFNNVPYKKGLTTSWGFACLVKGPDKTLLFDTGGEGEILLSNMEQLGLEPAEVNAVVLSHIDADHTGGLSAFLERNSDVTVFMPASFPAAFQQMVKRHGAKIDTVAGPQPLFEHVHSTGEMGEAIREQALILATSRGLVVMTGCAHPDVADMTERASEYLGNKITLLMGGFHLGGRSESAIRVIIRRLHALGVGQIAPSHCTGETAIEMFREAWGENYIEGGLGAHITLPK
ncbi:MAG: MBL fold metallo-hydrolase [Pseudomonadota bacterium]